ncbi:MAG: S-methyl-5-thioribose kinase [Jatrophihabitantaceae bacterium]
MLTPEAVPDYIAHRPAMAAQVDPGTLQVAEVGDGNLNLVFICTDASGRGLVLKQALPYVRLVGPSWPMTEQRADREAAAIGVHSALSDDVCRLIDFDADEHVLALEDLSNHEVLRTRLNNGGPHDQVADRLGVFVADIAFGTSFLGLGEEQFRLRAAAAANPEMCSITEDLIFTEPFLGAERNSARPVVRSEVGRLQADDEWVGAAMAMKYRFLSTQEALLHGDLHSGSVFVRGTGPGMSVKTFDSEFACYGPVGFDLGLMWANMLAASARGTVLGEPGRASSLLATVPSSWSAFRGRIAELWPRRRSPEKYPEMFCRDWLARIRQDALGFAGCEIARRIIGLAKISDIESLEDRQYAAAVGVLLSWSRALLVDRSELCFSSLTEIAPEAADGLATE